MANQKKRSGNNGAHAGENDARADENDMQVGKSTETEHRTASRNKIGWFTWFAQETAHLSGRATSFVVAALVIVVWAVSGPFFHYSDTWQLVINTGTTIVTFLMVFLIQNTQNRDTMALQVKLAELIIAVRGAHNNVAAAEDMCDEDLESLHKAYRKRADETLESLNERRSSRRSA